MPFSLLCTTASDVRKARAGPVLMGRNKDIRKHVGGWERQLREHQQKIEIERAKPAPDAGLIKHWESDIRTFKKNIDRLLRRLRRAW